MKKILSLIIIWIILLVNIFTGFLWVPIEISYAWSTKCSIENWTPELNKYIADIRAQLRVTIYKIIKNPEYNPDLNKKLTTKQRLQKEREEALEADWKDSNESFGDKVEKEANRQYEKIKNEEWKIVYEKTKNYLYNQKEKLVNLWWQFFRTPAERDNYLLSAWFWIWAIRYDYSIPIAIKRDFDRVRWESDRIKTYMDNLINSWINVDPEFDKTSYIIGIPWLLELNTLMEYAIMWAVAKWFKSNDDRITKQAQKTRSDLQAYIDKYYLNLDLDFLDEYTRIIQNEECRMDGSIVETAMKQIKEIWENWFEWVWDEWNEAFDLSIWAGLWWEATPKQKRMAEKKERELLKKLYWRLAWDDESVDTFLENLKDPLSWKRLNPISDKTKQEVNNFMQYIDQLEEQLSDLWDKFTSFWEDVPIKVKDMQQNSDTQLSKIEKTIEIRNVYEELKFLVPWRAKEHVDLKRKILNNHKTIAEWVLILEQTTKISEKVCKSQWVWMWKCDARDYTDN
jgi:hypothetical protein